MTLQGLATLDNKLAENLGVDYTFYRMARKIV